MQQRLPGVARGAGGHRFGGARDDQLAAMRPGLGTKIDHPIGRLDHVQIMLDDEDRMPGLHQVLKGLEQDPDIFEMQASCGLVKNKERRFGPGGFQPGEFGEMTDQFKPLAFASGKGVDRLSQAQVSETDLLQYLEELKTDKVSFVFHEDMGTLGPGSTNPKLFHYWGTALLTSIQVQQVPEPAAVLQVIAGLLASAMVVMRRRQLSDRPTLRFTAPATSPSPA